MVLKYFPEGFCSYRLILMGFNRQEEIILSLDFKAHIFEFFDVFIKTAYDKLVKRDFVDLCTLDDAAKNSMTIDLA
jgi:hypothetical protein